MVHLKRTKTFKLCHSCVYIIMLHENKKYIFKKLEIFAMIFNCHSLNSTFIEFHNAHARK